MNKKIVPFVVIAVVALAVGFGGGYALGKSKSVQSPGAPNFVMGGGNLQRGDFQGQPVGMMRQGRNNGGFGGVSGKILSKDAASLTVENRNGGSSVVFLAPSTSVFKPAIIDIGSLNVGDEVTVMGSANADGSIMANSIQVRPPQSATGSAPAPAQTK